MITLRFPLLLGSLLLASPIVPAAEILNDVTGLNPVEVDSVACPRSIDVLQILVRNHAGPIAIGGGRYSMGGQTAEDHALALDTRCLNRIVAFEPDRHRITVEAGITWRAIQQHIDPANLSLRIMQTYANFTVGGSLGVNAHGRYVGEGPLVRSVDSIRLVLADGSLVNASRDENRDLFAAAIGGYGGIGVMVEATLNLDDNTPVARQDEKMPFRDYPAWFRAHVRDNPAVVFHNADLYPDDYTRVRAVSWVKTDRPVTVKQRLITPGESYPLHRAVFGAISEWPFGKGLREHLIDPLVYTRHPVEWRNYEASYDVRELEPRSRKHSTYVLQEYFVPEDRLGEFVPRMAEILRRHRVNAINVSLRHARRDDITMLAWAPEDVFALVLYYKQGTDDAARRTVGVWTRELVDAALASGGRYYLPYQPHATPAQFLAAYPRSDCYFALKSWIDPDNKFRNRFLDIYYADWQRRHAPEPEAPVTASPEGSRFRRALADPAAHDRLYAFLQNVYGLYPPAEFTALVEGAAAAHDNDRDIYEAIRKGVPEITPALWGPRYAMPALARQKAELARETAALLGEGATVRGYLEVGTTGRYVRTLRHHLDLQGPVYLMNDETRPDFSPTEIVERGQISPSGTFLELNGYDPVPRNRIPDASLDLVTVYIGLHHAPPEKLDAFLRSLRRVLRPGGRLVVRDHDVGSPAFHEFVTLVHDVFNAGLNVPWDTAAAERHDFVSADALTARLQALGFRTDGRRLLQPHDPSRNTLMVFTKEENAEDRRESAIHAELDRWPGYRRDEGQTYLTLPEWFLVYNPDEYARHLAGGKPSGFPYFASVGQFWGYYGDVRRTLGDRYPFNGGYHLMVSVLGVSYTVENGIKGVWENSAGRLSEALSTPRLTDEDRLAAQVARDYVDFIEVRPWYEYRFAPRLKQLWTGTQALGRNPLRKLERRIILSEEYLEKSLYATLITGATRALYGVETGDMLARVQGLAEADRVAQKKLRVLKTFEDGTQLVALPRYLEFRDTVLGLSGGDVRFLEVAGNTRILLTGLANSGWHSTAPGVKTEFERPVLTEPGRKRVALTLDVPQMHRSLPQLAASGLTVEHLYDF